MIQIRPYDPKTDYPMLSQWWAGHGWPPVRAECLPKLGLLAMDGETAVAAAWSYLDNSVGVAFFEWLVTNPANHPKTSVAGIRHVTECMMTCLKDLGYRIVHSSCRQPSLARLLVKSDFTATDAGVQHLIRTL